MIVLPDEVEDLQNVLTLTAHELLVNPHLAFQGVSFRGTGSGFLPRTRSWCNVPWAQSWSPSETVLLCQPPNAREKKLLGRSGIELVTHPARGVPEKKVLETRELRVASK